MLIILYCYIIMVTVRLARNSMLVKFKAISCAKHSSSQSYTLTWNPKFPSCCGLPITHSDIHNSVVSIIEPCSSTEPDSGGKQCTAWAPKEGKARVWMLFSSEWKWQTLGPQRLDLAPTRERNSAVNERLIPIPLLTLTACWHHPGSLAIHEASLTVETCSPK